MPALPRKQQVALTFGGDTPQTMSSLEIESLTGSRHDKVKQSIERLAAKGVIVQPPAGIEQAPDSMGRMRATEVYLFSGDQGRRDSIIVVAQLCPEFTARIVDRWQELEVQVSSGFQVPQTFAQALMLAAQQAEKIEQQQAQLQLAAPKVAFVERYVEATGLKGFREVCKLLKANENRFREFLLEEKVMYRLGGALTAYQNHIDAGRFEVRTGVADVNEHAYTTTKFTPKGIDWIAGEWAKHQLRQEVAA